MYGLGSYWHEWSYFMSMIYEILNICHPVIIMVSIMLSFSNFNLNSITICTQFFLAFSILTFYYN